jgi:hypothetical protein
MYLTHLCPTNYGRNKPTVMPHARQAWVLVLLSFHSVALLLLPKFSYVIASI